MSHGREYQVGGDTVITICQHLALRWQPARGPAGGGRHESDSVSASEWARPYAYLCNVIARLPLQRANQIGKLQPYRWQPA